MITWQEKEDDMDRVRIWDRYEFRIGADVPVANPFTEVAFSARISWETGEVTVDGFYDGDGQYCFRFMPSSIGFHRFVTQANVAELNALAGTFMVDKAAEGVHGPVRTAGTRFRYADGAPFFAMGTTAYAWHYRPAEVRSLTLSSFREYGFNKVRMLVFPKQYSDSQGKLDISYEPPCYPFAGQPRLFDFKRPNPAYFRDLEQRVLDLMAIGVEADVILFHPYDSGHWGIDSGMSEDDALLYLKYIVARLASCRNVWWSLANEYDIDNRAGFVIGTTRRHWDVIGAFVQAHDPFGHLISCHNIPFGVIYPDRPWLSHVSYQHPDTYALMLELMARYRKPVINDEYQYEGNVPDDWGNSTAELVVERHWKSLMAGGYATHGEAYIRDNNRDIFWSYGGQITGESASRLRYLKEIALRCPLDDMTRDPVNTDGCHYFSLAKGTDFYLFFFRDDMPGKWLWPGPWDRTRAGVRYRATFYDVWNCRKIEEVELAASARIQITAFTAVTLERMTNKSGQDKQAPDDLQ